MSDDAYPWLLAPLSPRQFEDTYFERGACVVNRNSPDYYRDLLGIQVLDEVLATHRISHPEVTLVASGRDIPRSQYTNSDGEIDPMLVGQLFVQGATAIFTHLHRRVDSLARLCTDLFKSFSAPIQANVYLTPAGAQGFPAHWDTHDVFVLQVMGSKSWTIYDTKVQLPLRGQAFDHELHTAGSVTTEFELAAGDFAYVPRGLIHSAKASTEASLHITVGVLGVTWAELFLEGVAAAALDHVALREYLPLRFAQPGHDDTAFMALYAQRLATVIDHMNRNSAAEAMRNALSKRQEPIINGVFQRILQPEPVELGTAVRRVGSMWSIQFEDETCVFCNGMRVGRVPRFLSPAVEFLNSAPVCTVSQIPDCVDDDGKLTLVRRLHREGFLERSPTAASPAD